MTIDIDAIRQREQAATEGPWFYNSYAGVFSTPKVALWDPWLDSVDDSHSMERHGRCEACGKDGCRLFSEAYNRDPLVAHVPAHHGDTATGMHVADAEFVAHARTDVPALLAKVDELTAEREHMELNPTGTAEWLKNRVNELTAELATQRQHADDVMRMVNEYGVLRGTAAKLATYPGLEQAAAQRDLEASMLRDKIRKAVTR